MAAKFGYWLDPKVLCGKLGMEVGSYLTEAENVVRITGDGVREYL